MTFKQAEYDLNLKIFYKLHYNSYITYCSTKGYLNIPTNSNNYNDNT